MPTQAHWLDPLGSLHSTAIPYPNSLIFIFHSIVEQWSWWRQTFRFERHPPYPYTHSRFMLFLEKRKCQPIFSIRRKDKFRCTCRCAIHSLWFIPWMFANTHYNLCCGDTHSSRSSSRTTTMTIDDVRQSFCFALAFTQHQPLALRSIPKGCTLATGRNSHQSTTNTNVTWYLRRWYVKERPSRWGTWKTPTLLEM